jgi:hypothetical protein
MMLLGLMLLVVWFEYGFVMGNIHDGKYLKYGWAAIMYKYDQLNEEYSRLDNLSYLTI